MTFLALRGQLSETEASSSEASADEAAIAAKEKKAKEIGAKPAPKKQDSKEKKKKGGFVQKAVLASLTFAASGAFHESVSPVLLTPSPSRAGMPAFGAHKSPHFGRRSPQIHGETRSPATDRSIYPLIRVSCTRTTWLSMALPVRDIFGVPRRTSLAHPDLEPDSPGENMTYFLCHAAGTVTYVWLCRNMPQVVDHIPWPVGVVLVNLFAFLTSPFCKPRSMAYHTMPGSSLLTFRLRCFLPIFRSLVILNLSRLELPFQGLILFTSLLKHAIHPSRFLRRYVLYPARDFAHSPICPAHHLTGCFPCSRCK